MTAQDYNRISAPFRKSSRHIKLIIVIDKVLTGMVFMAYPLLLFILFIEKDENFFRCLFVPFFSLCIVTFFRAVYSAKRPYELLDITPLIPKETKGKSFPSKHVFSVFIIGMTFFYVNIYAGILVGIIGIFMGIVRVVGGVHFPKDVIAGGIFGIICGMAGYLL